MNQVSTTLLRIIHYKGRQLSDFGLTKKEISHKTLQKQLGLPMSERTDTTVGVWKRE